MNMDWENQLHSTYVFSPQLPPSQLYTKYDAAHFLINTVSLLSVLLPKLPQFHGVRLFGINKY